MVLRPPKQCISHFIMPGKKKYFTPLELAERDVHTKVDGVYQCGSSPVTDGPETKLPAALQRVWGGSFHGISRWIFTSYYQCLFPDQILHINEFVFPVIASCMPGRCWVILYDSCMAAVRKVNITEITLFLTFLLILWTKVATNALSLIYWWFSRLMIWPVQFQQIVGKPVTTIQQSIFVAALIWTQNNTQIKFTTKGINFNFFFLVTILQMSRYFMQR